METFHNWLAKKTKNEGFSGDYGHAVSMNAMYGPRDTVNYKSGSVVQDKTTGKKYTVKFIGMTSGLPDYLLTGEDGERKRLFQGDIDKSFVKVDPGM